MLNNVYVAGGVRTPFGSFNGSLASMTAPQLGSVAVRETLRRANVAATHVDHVYFGNVVQAGIGQNPARQVSRGAGIPDEVGAITINKVCGSSMRAVILASQAIQCGDANLIIAGGCESMSNAPYFLPRARTGYRMGDGVLVDGLIHDGLQDAYDGKHMGLCGDVCAAKYGFSREDQDRYAIASYKRAIQGWESGFFAGNVIPVEIKSKKETTLVSRDEDLARFREDKMASLPAAFGTDGTVTAGNASNIDDGAASMIVVGEERMRQLGIRPRARILGYANAATEPDWFTVAPVHALKRLAERLSLKLSNVDLFEINEAFSVVPLLAMKELGLSHDRVNAYGGAVAIGHPIGATGARIINTLVAGLHARGGRIGIATLCIGGGEADAIALERCD